MLAKRLSVVQVVDALSVGGKERVAVDLANGLAMRGIKSYVLATRSSGLMEQELERGVDFFCVHRTGRFDLKGIRRFAKWIEKHRISIVHTHNQGSSWLARLVLWFTKRRPIHVVHDHHGPSLGDRKISLLNWLMLRHVDCYIAVSEALRDQAQRLLKLPRDRCLYVRNGVLVPPVSPAYSGRPTVIQVANLHGPKDHATAMHAAVSLRKNIPDLRWRCVGRIADPPTPYIREIRQLVDTLGLEGCVELLGQRSDVGALLREANVGVLTSKAEGLPISLLECMAAGLPVVMTDVGQGPVIIREGQAGSVVPVADPQAIAKALEPILTNTDRAASMGTSGRSYVAEYYGVEAMVRELESLYFRLLAERDARG